MPSTHDAALRLEADRKDLLDFSLRNPLLNYRPKARGLEFLGESAASVFRILVREGRAMSFLHDEAAAEGPDTPLGSHSIPQANPDDLKLQTGLPADRLESRLLATSLAARTSVEEHGVNTLFLALGMLAWRKPDEPDRVLRAPLVLIPIRLQRSTARERFRLRHDGGEPGENLSLVEKLKTEFAITLPSFPEPDELEIPAYFEDVARRVADCPGWLVERDAVVMSFFSFGKFLMYQDLDGSTWPENDRPEAHPVLRALLGEGFHEPPPNVGDDDRIDPHVSPNDARQVVDADSSQILALLDVNRGRNLVIQGPPGTGKSQTITNLIAEAQGKGKTVLFVAEKMAALGVVKRRLDAAGLGDACLELHSRKTNKKAVLAELRRTLELGRPRVGPGLDDDLRLLGEVRDRLNAVCEAIESPIGDSDMTPYRVIGDLAADKPDDDIPSLDVSGMAEWAAYDFRRHLGLVEQLQGRLEGTGVPIEHRFFGAELTSLMPNSVAELRDLAGKAGQALDGLVAAASGVAGALQVDPPADLAGCDALIAWSERVISGAGLAIIDIQNEEWDLTRAAIAETIAAGRALARLHRRYDDTLKPEAWEQDLSKTRRDLERLGRRWSRYVSPAYWRARRRLATLCREPRSASSDDRVELADAVISARAHAETLDRHEPMARRRFGDRWRGIDSDWAGLESVADWVQQFRADVRSNRVPPTILLRLTGGKDLGTIASGSERLRAAARIDDEATRSLLNFLQFDEAKRFGAGGPFRSLSLRERSSLITRWIERPEEVRALVALNVVASTCEAQGLAAVVRLAESWPGAATGLSAAFRRRWAESLLERAYRERPALAGFDGRDQDRAVASFRELDLKSLRHARTRLALRHWEKLPRHDGAGQLAVLRREFEKKARHLPVRQLVARAGNAVQAIKPVFMMSPLSVATYLPPGAIQFDLVIFDEASQVRPVDAFGALARGRQAVVVGDSRQLPPSQFFDRLIAGDDTEDEPGDAAHDLESILGLFLAHNAPQRMLRWHYRSRHESLIAVSNHEFYDDRLVVFPSPDARRGETGLVFRHLPDTTYDRGKTRTNAGEAEAVALAVLTFARDQIARPEADRQTLGVAAFSNAQALAVVARLERLRRDEPALEAFFDEGADEPFFVKNLENVQGDERDVIFISIGYGRTADGKLAMSFGPLNNLGGERRLNVLITRARRRCEVFANFTADEIDLDRTSAWGVRALKTFLAYAGSGRLDVPSADTDDGSLGFDAVLRSALNGNGWGTRGPVGSAGSGVDLAVEDPAQPGTYLLGIETDGPTYGEARSARDRDRLRRQVLEGLGWRLHRIWSVAWLNDPDGERARVVAAIEAARHGRGRDEQPPAVTAPEDDSAPTTRESSGRVGVGESRANTAYRLATPKVDLRRRQLHAIPLRQLVAWVVEVTDVEGPVHVSEVVRRVTEASGAKRVGHRIQAALEAAIDEAVRRNAVLRDGDFLATPRMTSPTVRDRSDLPASARRLDLVAPVEIARAIEQVVAEAFGMERASIPQAACRLLGFPRLSDEMRARVEPIVETLVHDGRLITRGQHLVLNETPG